MKHVALWVILLSMPVRSASVPHNSRTPPSTQFADNAEVRAALAWFAHNLAWINEQQLRLTEIPAPPFQEAQRAVATKALLASSGLEVQIAKTGNLIAELRGPHQKHTPLLSPP